MVVFPSVDVSNSAGNREGGKLQVGFGASVDDFTRAFSGKKAPKFEKSSIWVRFFQESVFHPEAAAVAGVAQRAGFDSEPALRRQTNPPGGAIPGDNPGAHQSMPRDPGGWVR